MVYRKRSRLECQYKLSVLIYIFSFALVEKVIKRSGFFDLFNPLEFNSESIDFKILLLSKSEISTLSIPDFR